MNNINTEIVLKKLSSINRDIKRLEEFSSLTVDEYLNDYRKQLPVERLLELIIQNAIDINSHILSKLYPGNNLTNFETFIELAKYNVISANLAKQIAPSSGLRNRLVHEYDDMDSRQIFIAIDFALQQYPLYVKQINEYLISLDVDND